MPNFDFLVGQKAVYPSHGVAVIENIESCNIGGQAQDFYVLKIQGSGAKVMVPTSAARSCGLRSVIEQPEVEKIYNILKTPCKKNSSTPWNRRFRALTEKMGTGSLEDVAEVLRDLTSLQSSKELSFGEKKMLEKAQHMIVSELSAAQNKESTTIELEIRKFLVATV